MQFSIEILNISRETKQSSNGQSYQMLDVAYKNLTNGKTEGKKIFSFNQKTEKVYKMLNDATAGGKFEITSEKGEKYWDWVDIKPLPPETVGATKVVIPTKSTYETPEERARRQVLIVKQSSIGAAIELLSVGAKTPPTTQMVLDVAQKFTDWVFSTERPPETLMQMQNDMEFDDVPH